MSKSGIATLNYFNSNRKALPSMPGVYILYFSPCTPLHRIGGIDKHAIVYIGRTTNLNSRIVHQLLYEPKYYSNDWTGYHLVPIHFAAWWDYGIKKVYAIKHDSKISFHKYFKNAFTLWRLSFICTPQHKNLEAALLAEYHRVYGELPPMNFSLPQRLGENIITKRRKFKIDSKMVNLQTLINPCYYDDISKHKI
jgi:hypothetical protein